MLTKGKWERSILIRASATVVDRCLTEWPLIRRWRNGLVTWEAGDDPLVVGSRGRWHINHSLWPLRLGASLVQREPGLVVWQLSGGLQGLDRWECRPQEAGTQLYHCWDWHTSGGVYRWWPVVGRLALEDDSEAQLMRIKYVAEEIYCQSGRQ
jgi:hypothetical protein